MNASAENPKFSYAQYLALAKTTDGLLEYHDGEVVETVEQSFEHVRIVSQLVHALHLRNRSPCIVAPAGLRVRIESSNHTLMPDVSVICDELRRSPTDRDAIVNPVIVFEVASPGTSDDDYAKLHQYRTIASLREYVIVAEDRRFASVCRRVGDLWGFEDIEADGVVRLEGLGIELPLGSIYTDALGVIVA